ncbi:MAG: porin, partial [Sulfitobacter sp. SK025]
MLPRHLLSSITALLALSAMPALAELKYSNDTGGSVKLYGQLSPAYLSFDDGVASYGDLVDNEVSNTRAGLTVTQDYGSSVLQFDFLTALGFGQSSNYGQAGDPKFLDWRRTFVRKLEVSWKTESAGTFTFGQGSMATDGVAQSDLSGTKMAMYNGLDTVA